MPCRRARPRTRRGAHDCRRSTAALAQGTFVAKGSAPGQASWDAANRFGLSVERAVTRPDLSQSSDSTSRAGRSAGKLMPDVARERVAKPPAGTAYFGRTPEPAGPSAPNHGRGWSICT
jgi:hypothetical protein